jgi:hypothetical protein
MGYCITRVQKVHEARTSLFCARAKLEPSGPSQPRASFVLMYQSIPEVPIPPPGHPRGISHFWEENVYVPTPGKEELC